MKLQHSRMRSPGQPGHTLQTLDLARVRQAGEAYRRARQLDARNARLAPKIDSLQRVLTDGAK